MLNSTTELRDSAHMLESYSREGRADQFYSDISDCFQSGEIDANRISIRGLFENFVENGREAVEDFNPRNSQTGVLMESGAVNTGAFSNIIGQMTYSRVLNAMEGPGLIGHSLMTTVPADTQGVEIVPGVSRIGDQAEDVGEDQTYPRIGLSEEYVTVPRKIKDGFILPITEEAIWEDKTGLLLRRMDEANSALAITMEKELLDTALGLATSYSRNGGKQQATYANTHTEGDFDNLIASNAMVDFKNIENALLAFDAMTDPNTGEPVIITGQLKVVVPTALEMTARQILSATELREVTNTTRTTVSGNPLSGGSRAYDLVSSQYVKNRTGSPTTWYIGDFTGAFEYREIWPVQVFRMDKNSEEGFNRDVAMAVKVRRKGVPAVMEPRKVIKCTA